MFEALNTRINTVREGINTESMSFVPLSNFNGRTIEVDGFFFTLSKYGKQVVVVGNGCKINMPKRAVEQFEKIYENEEMLKAVLDGKMIITDIKSGVKTKNGDTTTYTLADK